MTFSTLRALQAAIGAAIDDIERVYHERSQGNTLEYPSLDEPYYHTAEHTPEEELAEALKDDPAVVAASTRIVAACGQLATTVNKPFFGLMENLLRGQFTSAIRFLEAANVVEILREAGPEGLHVSEIHRLVLELRANSKSATLDDTVPLTPARLISVLRLLATAHHLTEVKPNVFANNRVSSYIDSGKTVAQLRAAPEKKYNDTDGIAAYVAHSGDESLKFMSYFPDWALSEKRLIGRTHTNPDDRAPQPPPPPPPEGQLAKFGSAAEPVTTRAVPHYDAAFNLAFNTQLDFFSWLELPENEHRLERFGHAMMGTRQFETKGQILRAFSWEELPQGSVLVDVGGGIGAQSIAVADAYPHIRVVVEDREPVIAGAASAWGAEHAHLFESGRMSFRARDFFEAWAPLALPGRAPADAPDVLLLRSVLHDWKDEDCKRILTRLRAAAGPHTKLLLGDMQLQHACADDAAYAAADGSGATFPFVPRDSPLLPNLGVGNLLGYMTDILMMGIAGAQERTADEITALTLSTGWKIVEVRRTPGAIWSYTTAVPV